MKKVNLAECLAGVDQAWVPLVVAELNGQLVKLARFDGEYVWHSHAEEDEFFLVVDGRVEIQLRDRVVELEEGECFVVPRGIEHRPVAMDGASVLMFEPAETRNTGDLDTALTIEPDDLRRI